MRFNGCADLPGNSRSLGVRARKKPLSGRASQNKRTLGIVSDLGSNVLDPPLPFVSEKVEAQTVLCRMGFRDKTGPKHNPLRGVHDTLEYGILHPLSMIFA
jgi:hypothetical protein